MQSSAKIFTFSFLLVVLVKLPSLAQTKDYLQTCWEKQVKPLQAQTLHFSFQEKKNELEHSFEPWQQSTYLTKGRVWLNFESYVQSDTLVDEDSNRSYYSVLQQNTSALLFRDYGNQELSPTTKSLVAELPIKTARYQPFQLIQLFHEQNTKAAKESDGTFAIYKRNINTTHVTLYIRKADQLLSKIVTLHDDELFGDVQTTYTYSNYTNLQSLYYPRQVFVEKINGKLKDEITLTAESFIHEVPALLQKPSNYAVQEDVVVQPEIKTEKFSSNIHFIELKHTDDRVMLVEFKDFLLVAEAPLNSQNGELILQEAAKITPSKPVKYFVFGHYHPHYLGGIRPFIQRGAKVICIKSDQDYVRYLASAPHTLNPDKLQQEPKPVYFEEVKDSLTITDGSFEMKVYFIGSKSQHTNDYLIYYFPSEKLLFEDDLVWIARQGEIKKAGARQAGLYHAVKDLGLAVETIVQSWPVADYGVKTVIPFSDLEKSMQVK